MESIGRGGREEHWKPLWNTKWRARCQGVNHHSLMSNVTSPPQHICPRLVEDWETWESKLVHGNSFTHSHPGLCHTNQVYSLFWQIILLDRGLIVNSPGIAEQQCQKTVCFLAPQPASFGVVCRLKGNQAFQYLRPLPLINLVPSVTSFTPLSLGSPTLTWPDGISPKLNTSTNRIRQLA